MSVMYVFVRNQFLIFTMVEIATNVLDHIVHLVPPETLNQASDEFRALGFTLSDVLQLLCFGMNTCFNSVLSGGVHAGGFTTNALVVCVFILPNYT